MLLAAVIGAAGGGAGSAFIIHFMRRRVTDAEADHLLAQAADILVSRQQDQLDRGDVERVRMETEIDQLHVEVQQLREDITDERLRCDEQLAMLRSEIVKLALEIHPHRVLAVGTSDPGTHTRRATDTQPQRRTDD